MGSRLAFCADVCICLGVALTVAVTSDAKPPLEKHEWTPIETGVDRVGDTVPTISKALGDTVWIADWSFDESCTNAIFDGTSSGEQVPGWFRYDLRILNDGNVYWKIRSDFDGAVVDTLGPGAADDALISGNAAVLTQHDLCWGFPDGYGTSWYQAICIRYVGDSWLTFDVLVDSEPNFDFLYVQTDRACASAELVDYDVDQLATGFQFRDTIAASSGHSSDDSLALNGYGTADTHCVYVAFLEDGAANQQDGFQPTVNGAALVVDNIVLEGVYPSSQDWDGGGTGACTAYTFVNLHDAKPFGTWMRVFQAITDNDLCTWNNTCAWLDTDHTTPTLANRPEQAFAPGGFVAKFYKDTAVIGPWVSLTSTGQAVGTVLSFRRFPGNFFAIGRGVQSWSVRSRVTIDNTDSAAPGDSLECVTSWSHAFQWNSLNAYAWVTSVFDMSPNVALRTRAVQVRFRNADWCVVAGCQPIAPYIPCPGPFWDRVRIGRRILHGPVISRGHRRALASAGRCADQWQRIRCVPRARLGAESRWRCLRDDRVLARGGWRRQRPNREPDSRRLHHDHRHRRAWRWRHRMGQLVRHDRARSACGQGTGTVHGGRQRLLLHPGGYGARRWSADAGRVGDRSGRHVLPRRRRAALRVVGHRRSRRCDVGPGGPRRCAGGSRIGGGRHGRSARGELPAVDRVGTCVPCAHRGRRARRLGADAGRAGQLGAGTLHPVLQPREREALVGGWKPHVVHANAGSARLQGFLRRLRSSGAGQHEQRAGLAVDRGAGPKLRVAGDGRGESNAGGAHHSGRDRLGLREDRHGYVAHDVAAGRGAGNGDSEPHAVADRQGLGARRARRPVDGAGRRELRGTRPSDGHESRRRRAAVVRDGAGLWSERAAGELVARRWLSGAGLRRHRAAWPRGGTHTYDDDGIPPIAAPGTGKGAIVMRADAGYRSNTIMQSHPWSDIRDFGPPASPEPEALLLAQVLGCVLPLDCRMSPDPEVGVPGDDVARALPVRTVLHPNVPNPFNPTTAIHFDLAHSGHANLRIYDVAGRVVRTLVNDERPAGAHQVATWDGLDGAGNRVPAGVYFYRLVTADFDESRKMVLMK